MRLSRLSAECVCRTGTHARCHAHAHEAGHSARRVRGGCVHGRTRLHRHVAVRGAGAIQGGSRLHALDKRFVFFGSGNGIHAEGHNGNTAQVRPLRRQHFIQRIGNFNGVTRHSAVTDAHFGDACERRLQSAQHFGLQLAVNLVARVNIFHVAANVLVEQNGVNNLVGVLAVAANGNVQVKACILVNNAEGDGACRAVLVADNLFGVEEVDALVFARVAAEREALAQVLEGGKNALLQIAVQDAGLGAGLVNELARRGANVHNGAVFNDDSALAFVHGNDGTVGDNVGLAFSVRAAALVGGSLLSLCYQYVGFQGIAIEVLTPLIGKNAAQGTYACFQKTHSGLLSKDLLLSLS